jgi:hypothetical protein
MSTFSKLLKRPGTASSGSTYLKCGKEAEMYIIRMENHQEYTYAGYEKVELCILKDVQIQ